MNKRMIALISTMLVTALTGCSSAASNNSPANNGGSGAKPETLRIAMGSPGEGLIKVWETIGKEFEAQHQGIKVEFSYQDDDTYQTIGLPNLLSGKNAPDLYFEWAGQRLQTRVTDGYAADITEQLQSSGLKDMFAEGTFNGMVIDGKTYMIPTAGDVTNVIFYNKAVFNDLGLQPPATWEEFLKVCETIKQAGITPLVIGNSDLWTAGNWVAHIISRVVGEDAYSEAMQLKQPFNSPDFVKAYGYVQELWDKGYINENVTAASDSEADMLFLNGSGAMHPIGSWLAPTAVEETPELELGYFNTPAIPDGKGNQDSVIGVLNGMVVNKNSRLIDEAIEFMKLYSSPESSKKLSDAGAVPITKDGIDKETMLPLSLELNDLMENAPALVSPPDTGYSIEVANALNMATSEVIGGAKSPEEALAELETTIAPLK
ncbi:sugar ABC transporter extracellular binding protein [Paenibacillus sp. FSL R7-277]|uniref:ABC transporter substrate-binding protein n=1 Tax=Paenibacillus sp. FSL R7-277 TaxID=1227352 RepID=UPI0003E1EF6C|nr:sugar ABC transporter substrate-binding protein [Paenibacillus sp. FSL R7-277]ETT75963.1 sugar ABC transporter extracellular binding protein [Paenibacillus sp. FSL R7-277]